MSNHLIHRPKPVQDNATPSKNGVAASTINRLGRLIGEYQYFQAAENTIKSVYTEMS